MFSIFSNYFMFKKYIERVPKSSLKLSELFPSFELNVSFLVTTAAVGICTK